MEKRRVLIIIGSDSDISQCEKGLMLLSSNKDKTEVIGVITCSIHRNTDELLQVISRVAEKDLADVIIAGAGMANHLTGTIDAYLRYALRNKKISVIGVAFNGKKFEDNVAATLSIIKVLNTQVIYKGVGSTGFLDACDFAIFGELPKIILPFLKYSISRELKEALKFIEIIKEER